MLRGSVGSASHFAGGGRYKLHDLQSDMFPGSDLCLQTLHNIEWRQTIDLDDQYIGDISVDYLSVDDLSVDDLSVGDIPVDDISTCRWYIYL